MLFSSLFSSDSSPIVPFGGFFSHVIAVGFSKEIVVVRQVFIKIKFSQMKRCSVRQPVVTRNFAIATIGGPCGGVSGLVMWFMFLHES